MEKEETDNESRGNIIMLLCFSFRNGEMMTNSGRKKKKKKKELGDCFAILILNISVTDQVPQDEARHTQRQQHAH